MPEVERGVLDALINIARQLAWYSNQARRDGTPHLLD
jgi:hypothetical protein